MPVLGRWLTFFAERAEHPASSLMLAATEALALHWATGQSPVEDQNLGAILGWIDPPPGQSGAQAAAAAEDPVRCPPAGPATDPTFDNEVLGTPDKRRPHREVHRDGAYDHAKAALTDALATQLAPTWTLMWRAVDLLRSLPAGGHVRARWDADKDAFTWHARHLRDGGPPQPRRDGAVSAARRLASLERVQQMVAAQRAFDDPLIMAEYRLVGEAFAGQVAAAEPDRVDATGRRRVLRPRIAVDTDDEVLASAGAELTSPARPNQKARVIEVTQVGGRTRVVLELQGGMGRSLTPEPGSVPADRRARVLRHLQRRLPAPAGIPGTGGHPVDARRPAAALRPVRRGRPGGLVMSTIAPAALAEQATARILADLGGDHRGIVVDSPPGAGKSTLVVRVAAELADTGENVMVIAQTNEQVDDLTDRLATARPRLAIGRLAASEYVPSERVAAHGHVTVSAKVPDLSGCRVLLSTAHKWATVSADTTWPWAIVDEAYQMRSDLLLRVAGLFDRALFVGDPGQLDPFSRRADRPLDRPDLGPDAERRRGAAASQPGRAGAHAAGVLAAAGVRRTRGGRRRSTRSPDSAPPPGAAAPDGRSAPARSAKMPLTLPWRRRRPPGWALYELPARHTCAPTPRRSPRAPPWPRVSCSAVLFVIPNGLAAGAPVTADRIAVGDRAPGPGPGDPLRSLRANGLPGITVDTANRLQGREFDVGRSSLHPLSGRRDATAFHLEAGRLCVLPPGTGTPASSSPGPASPSCSTPTPPLSPST